MEVTMKSITVVWFIFIVLFEVHQRPVGAQVPEKSCRQTFQELTKLQLGLMGQCSKSMKFKNGKEKAKKQNCILRCAMIQAEMTDKDGQVSPDSVDFLLNKFIPPSLQQRANTTFYSCMEPYFTEPFKTLEEDPFCTTYDPFIKCFMQKATSFCE